MLSYTGSERALDRARVLLRKYSGGLELHRLRHSAATHLGDQKVPLQLIMAKTRHKSPRTGCRPGPRDSGMTDPHIRLQTRWAFTATRRQHLTQQRAASYRV